MLANTIVYGFVNSVILMLVALGFNLTFGISGVANFAYGALYILGALLSWVFFNSLGLPFFIAIILGLIRSHRHFRNRACYLRTAQILGIYRI
jgi:branched-chain amino acid transport system permease protein